MVVFTNGCFDVLHRGHMELLRYCDDLILDSDGFGDVIVGLNSDSSVKRLKGDNRPINNQEDRKYLLDSIKFVDEVIIFNEDTPYELIKKVKPDVIVKGGDYKEEDVVGNDLAKVAVFNYIDGYSTSNTIRKSQK